jgi:hypothetical protein
MNYEQKKYIFKESYKTNEGTIPAGSEIILFRGFVYMNGGMIHLAYQKMIKNIINNTELKEKYLKEIPVIHNKI